MKNTGDSEEFSFQFEHRIATLLQQTSSQPLLDTVWHERQRQIS